MTAHISRNTCHYPIPPSVDQVHPLPVSCSTLLVPVPPSWYHSALYLDAAPTSYNQFHPLPVSHSTFLVTGPPSTWILLYPPGTRSTLYLYPIPPSLYQVHLLPGSCSTLLVQIPPSTWILLWDKFKYSVYNRITAMKKKLPKD